MVFGASYAVLCQFLGWMGDREKGKERKRSLNAWKSYGCMNLKPFILMKHGNTCVFTHVVKVAESKKKNGLLMAEGIYLCYIKCYNIIIKNEVP